MAKFSDLLNPDKWIANGQRLLEFPMPNTEENERKFDWILADDPELLAHLGRWMARIGELVGPEKEIAKSLTEEQLRALWEETRDGVIRQ